MVQISSEAMNCWETSPPPLEPGLPGRVLPSSSTEQLPGWSGSSNWAKASFSTLVLSSPLTRLKVTPANSMPIFSSSPQVMHLFSWASAEMHVAVGVDREETEVPHASRQGHGGCRQAGVKPGVPVVVRAGVASRVGVGYGYANPESPDIAAHPGQRVYLEGRRGVHVQPEGYEVVSPLHRDGFNINEIADRVLDRGQGCQVVQVEDQRPAHLADLCRREDRGPEAVVHVEGDQVLVAQVVVSLERRGPHQGEGCQSDELNGGRIPGDGYLTEVIHLGGHRPAGLVDHPGIYSLPPAQALVPVEQGQVGGVLSLRRCVGERYRHRLPEMHVLALLVDDGEVEDLAHGQDVFLGCRHLLHRDRQFLVPGDLRWRSGEPRSSPRWGAPPSVPGRG